MCIPSSESRDVACHTLFKTIPDFSEWTALAREVRACRPDCLVLLARKMTRLWQHMRNLDGETFLCRYPTISHYALDYIDKKRIEGKKVIIIDDALNVGSTMKHVYNKLVHLGAAEVHSFVLGAKADFNPEDLGNLANTLHIICPKKLDDQKYHAKSASINRCLLLSGLPLELEFPVYELSLTTNPDEFMETLYSREQGRSSRLTQVDAAIAGFERLSVTRHDEQGNRSKYRFYFGKNPDRVLCVPMPLASNTTGIPRFAGRADLYACGMKLMEQYLPHLSQYGVQGATILAEDTELLFGAPFNATMVAKDRTRKREEDASDTWFLDVLESSPEFTGQMKKFPYSGSLRLTFVKLFQTLGNAVNEHARGTETPVLKKLPLPVREGIKQDNFLRLCLGLTFSEIVALLETYWENTKKISLEKISSFVSQLLDEHIDQGFVVPTLDPYGRRVFRKGEAAPKDRALLYALGWEGAVYGDDLEEILTNLPVEARARCIEFLQDVEAEGE